MRAGASLRANTLPSVVAAFRAFVTELVQTGLVRQALKASDIAPMFRLRSSNGDFVSLSEVLDRGPAVISFFRGGWCPFCRLELRALTQARAEIERFGATLIGLSPLPNAESCFKLPDLDGFGMQDRRPLSHCLHSGSTSPARIYFALGYPERSEKGPDRWVLPLPATYIIDRGGIVVLSYVDADYTTRLEPTEIAVALAHLRARANPSSSV